MIAKSCFCFLVIILSIVYCNCIVYEIGHSCPIPNQHNSGNCVIKENCTEYVKLYTSSISKENINFLQSVQCDNRNTDDETVVCCPKAGKTYENPRVYIDLESFPEGTQIGLDDRIDTNEDDTTLLPGPNVCGVEAVQNRIFGGDFTTLTEFPWMALLVFEDNGIDNLGCAGTLISKRYVLTAAHCVTGIRDRINGELRKIRLGEYDTQNTKDCILFGDQKICADPILEVGYEKIIVHQNYSKNSKHRHNDIALIRLDREIKRTRYIRPICLPIDGQTSVLKLDQRLTVAGWGRTDLYIERYGIRKSPIKLKLKLPVVPIDQCQRHYNVNSIHLGPGQVCAGGVNGQDSCSADSGGPLMYFDTKKASHYLAGIVSFGAVNCGTENLPGVYTNVASYTQWIIENLEK